MFALAAEQAGVEVVALMSGWNPHQLHPSILDDLGLATAVESECASWQLRSGLSVEFRNSPAAAEPAREVGLCLYRITQEALRNVEKHSGIREARVFLDGAANEVSLRVEDSGSGFDPEQARHQWQRRRLTV